MAIFPILEFEKSLQVLDKTRLLAEKSFVSKGSTAITTLTVTPGADASAISVFDADTKNRYLDWIFKTWAFDVDATNNKIDFQIGGTTEVATLTTGTYTESGLLTEIETQLLAEGLTAASVTIDADKKIKITSSASFKLLPETGVNRDKQILKHIGFAFDGNQSAEQIGAPLEYGIRKVTLTAGDGVTTETQVQYMKVFSEFGDRLFCSDFDIEGHESDTPKWVKNGRSSFKNVIRRSQELILEWFAGKGWLDDESKQLTKWAFPITSNLRDWSTYMSLRLIFDDLSNTVGDTFSQAARAYEEKEVEARQRFIATDFRGDGNQLRDEFARTHVCNLFMR